MSSFLKVLYFWQFRFSGRIITKWTIYIPDMNHWQRLFNRNRGSYASIQTWLFNEVFNGYYAVGRIEQKYESEITPTPQKDEKTKKTTEVCKLESAKEVHNYYALWIKTRVREETYSSVQTRIYPACKLESLKVFHSYHTADCLETKHVSASALSGWFQTPD